MPLVRIYSLLVALSVTLAAACGDSSSAPRTPAQTGTGPQAGPPSPAQLHAYGDLTQYAPPLGVVDKPPAVQVVRASGDPVAGVTVHFSVTGGGGEIRDTVAVTDATGVATCGRWTLGATEATNTVVAAVSYQGWSSQITFSVLAVRTDGMRFNLVKRDGSALRAGEEGFLILASDSTFRTVWTCGGTGRATKVPAIAFALAACLPRRGSGRL